MSPFLTKAARRYFLFESVDFLVRIWRKLAFLNFALPLAVNLNRLSAARFVFIFGIVATPKFKSY
jgi:hypothetical protein